MKTEIVWQAKLDEKYGCAVARIAERQGRLVVTNEETKEVLLDKQVPLAYGALFGPDMSDVTEWQELCIAVVDGVSGNA